MKKSVITLGGKRVLLGLLFLASMMVMESCSSCGAYKWRKKRYVDVETKTDTLPQFAFVNNQIIILR